MEIITLNNGIIFLGFIAFLYPIYQVFIEKKKIRFIDVLFIIVGLSIMILSIINEAKNKNEKQELTRISDSTRKSDNEKLSKSDSTQNAITRKSILDSLGIGNRSLVSIRAILDSINKKNNKLTQTNEEIPFLRMKVLDTDNPIVKVKDKDKGKFEVTFAVESGNSEDVYYPRNSLIGFVLQSDKITHVSRFLTTFSNESTVIYKGIYTEFPYSLTLNNKTLSDTLYFYFKIRYQDKKGKELAPLRNIYIYNQNNQEINTANDEKFRVIKKDLIAKKLW